MKNLQSKSRPTSMPKHKKRNPYLLEATTLVNLQLNKRITNEILKYQWNYYSELARQRGEIQEQIKQVLIQSSISYELKNWQRAVKYKYGLHPLSTMGSLTFNGGRFNTGTDSFIVLDDEPPTLKVPGKLDSSTWRVSELEQKDI